MKNEDLELDRLKKKGKRMNANEKTMKIWEKNLKQGYRFFEPHNAHQPTPRTLREAHVYQSLRKYL